VNREVGHATAILENLPTNTKRTDALEAAQVDGWWSGVEQLGNRRPGGRSGGRLVAWRGAVGQPQTRRPRRWPAGGLAWSSWATADPGGRAGGRLVAWRGAVGQLKRERLPAGLAAKWRPA